MRIHICLAVVGVAALGASLVAQQATDVRLVPPTGGLKFSAPWRPSNSPTGETKIVGVVIDVTQAPVGRAKVRLRNLKTGEVIQEIDTNDNGEYAFDLVDPGSYVVEMVMADGSVIGLSNAGTLNRYETFQSVVQLPGRWDTETSSVVISPTVSSYLGMSAATSIMGQTLAIATLQNVPPSAPGEHLSGNE